ncbi:DUF2231 domain-containing protein [Cognatilysobacter bugurensis]|uniref:Membrane protein n=1 Tax=Cognatilysobacter bugurensis TaxID=543356 RepID=A0A918SYG7_9GAMM|nr:DUF2231 domain-containing protein [Lysobacter bugurensis]GHA79213.1 membrane protein [Lysobacter bugurensis]
MAATVNRTASLTLHPLHAVLLASTLPLFLGALLTDIAYAKTYHVQWTNFASWLVLAGVMLAGLVLVVAIVGLLRSHRRDARSIAYVALVFALFVLGLINSLVHAKDAWAAMPGGLVLSAVTLLLAVAATWLGFAHRHTGDVA